MTFDPSKLSDEALSELLLAFAQGRTDAEQSQAIESVLSTDPNLAEEVAYYRGLSNALKPLRDQTTVNDLGWARLSDAIAADQNGAATSRDAANDNQPFWKYAAAALAVVAALQTAFLVQGNSTQDEPTYITASAESTEVFALDIMFREDAASSDVTAALRSVDAEIFEGPSALGIYAIRFETARERDTALQALNDQPDIVDSVSLR